MTYIFLEGCHKRLGCTLVGTCLCTLAAVEALRMSMSTELREVTRVQDFYFRGFFVCFPPPPIIILLPNVNFVSYRYVGYRGGGRVKK